MTCKYGHDSPRYKSGNCIACEKERGRKRWADDDGSMRARNRAYQLANKEKIQESNKRWREENPEKAKASHAAWYAANAEYARQYKRDWRAANPEINRERLRACYQKNRDKYLAMAKAHYRACPDSIEAARRTRRAKLKGCSGKHTQQDIRDLLEAQKFKCVYCRKSLRNGYHVDHIMPLKLGGSNDRRNIQLLCQPCNSRKAAAHPVIFAQRIGLLV